MIFIKIHGKSNTAQEWKRKIWTERRGFHQTLLSYQEETRIGFLFLPGLQQDAIFERCPYRHDKKLYKKGHPSLYLTNFLSHTQKCKNK